MQIQELRKKAMALPKTPGVYLMKNEKGNIIYVGKAKALKNRVSQYFGSQNTHSVKVRRMVENVFDFDYILTDSEFEALVLECSLIKQYSPKYNICKCFSCGACYDIFDLIGIDYNTDSFKDKLEIASELYPNVADIVFDRYDVIENNNTVIDFTNYFKKCISKINETDYLESRSIDKSLYEKYKIGYDDKRKMVVFPINKNCYFGRSVVG